MMEANGLAKTLESLLQDADKTETTTELPDILADTVTDQARAVVEHMVGFKELMMMYTCAIKEVRTKFDVLNTEFNIRYRRNPIYCISTRLKRANSIFQKMERMGLPFTLSALEKNLHDIAGVRVVCSYTDDIYRIADSLLRQNDIKLIERKDYIVNPKPNGYRSLHLIVSVPVFFADRVKEIQVEVQIRTIAMDYWASLEHQLKYKHRIANERQISEELHRCAETLAATDARMLAIRREIEMNEDVPAGDQLLLEKLSKLDVRID